jgi:hypothetical protein
MPRIRPIQRDLYRADIARLRPGHCAVCGESGTADAPLIVLVPRRDQAARIEVHATCQPAWYRRRGMWSVRQRQSLKLVEATRGTVTDWTPYAERRERRAELVDVLYDTRSEFHYSKFVEFVPADEKPKTAPPSAPGRPRSEDLLKFD